MKATLIDLRSQAQVKGRSRERERERGRGKRVVGGMGEEDGKNGGRREVRWRLPCVLRARLV